RISLGFGDHAADEYRVARGPGHDGRPGWRRFAADSANPLRQHKRPRATDRRGYARLWLAARYHHLHRSSAVLQPVGEADLRNAARARRNGVHLREFPDTALFE